MKRKIVWLALPLVLGALMLGVKWRAEHPMPTKEDLEIRALMLKSKEVRVIHYSPSLNNRYLKEYVSNITIKELTPFIKSFYLTLQMNELLPLKGKSSGGITIEFLRGDIGGRDSYIHFSIDMDKMQGDLLYDGTAHMLEKAVHPITVSIWKEMLINHPRIGPELRTRINQAEPVY